MSVIRPATSVPFITFYTQEDLRPFSNKLTSYTKYSLMIREARAASKSVSVLVRKLKQSTALRNARRAAQAELQRVYDHIAFGLRLPRLPVRLSLRKRVRIGGQAVLRGNAYREIRIFPLWGVVNKNRLDWQAREIGVSKPFLVCEILLHEIAHAHQMHFERVGDHEHSFVRSYLAIERVMLGFGFGPLLPQSLRFYGCPPRSFASTLYATPRPEPEAL